MAKCPKCGLDFSVAVRKCPNCHTVIASKKTDIMELPKLKKEKTVVEVNNDDSQKEIVVMPIPLKVKKVEEHYNEENTQKEKVSFSFRLKSTIKAVVVLLLLVLNVYLIFTIVLQVDGSNPSIMTMFNEPVAMEMNSNSLSLSGHWMTQNDGMFAFQDNGNFYWYDNYQVRDDNYFGGIYTYKNGLEAIEEMGYSEEEFYKNFDEEIDLDNVYSLVLEPIFSYKNRKDNTVNDLNEDEVWWYLLIVNDDDTAYGYNKTLDLRYSLRRAE